MRTGVRIGVDVGKVRIGIARSDPHGMLATPVETVQRGAGDVKRIAEIAAEFDALEFVVGLPLSMAGTDSASTGDARAFADALARELNYPVRLVDERLSTVSAHSAMRASGRSQKQSRSVIDQVAAVIILQNALDVERAGREPGVVVNPDEGTES